MIFQAIFHWLKLIINRNLRELNSVIFVFHSVEHFIRGRNEKNEDGKEGIHKRRLKMRRRMNEKKTR